MGKLQGKVAFISGIARGQGRSHAVRLAQEGADIVGFDLCAQIDSVEYPMATRADLDETVAMVEKLDRRIVTRVADVRDFDAVRDLAAEAVDTFGRLDIVLANAGILPITGSRRHDRSAFLDAVDVMLTGVFNTVHAAAPHLITAGGGSIVITSSTAGLKGLGDGTPGALGYVAAKHAVVGLARAWTNSLGPHSIRVNTVHPTGVNTPMVVNEAFSRLVQEEPAMVEQLRNVMPVKLIEPVDISNAIVFLCSEEGRYVTGQTLGVDAGFTAR
jgi:SDR family mycofactocin-dependent oxidoreductase